MRARELARAALDRCRADQGLEDQNHEQAGFACLVVSVEIAHRRWWNRDLSPRRIADVSRAARRHAQPRGISRAQVVAGPLADVDLWLAAAVDWDKTIAFREHVWDLGLGVAEAMDTAQRGMGLDWPTSLELIQRSVRAAKARGNALVFSGAGTDHLAPEDAKSLDNVIRAYEEQIAAVEKADGLIILMASRALAKIGRSPDDYARVYDRVLSQVREPVIIHWLGDMFDPALANYWGTSSLDRAMDIAVGIINANAAKVEIG